MKLLVISQYYSPDITAAAFRIKESVDGLRDMGVKIHILTSTPHKSSQRIDQKEDVTSNIWRVNVPVFSKPSRINYIIQYLTFCFRSIIVALRIRKDFDYDIIFATSPPITIAFTAFFVRFLTKKPLIVDIRDIWPDSAVAVGKLRKDSIIFKILKSFELFIYKKADGITCVAKPMSEYIRQLSERNDICLVYNGVDKGSKNREVIRNTQYRNNEFIMCYAGNLGFAQGISEILNAFIIFNEKFVENNFRLNLIGEGPEKQVTESLVKSHNLENKITFFGSLSKKETITYLNNSDVLLIPLIKSEAFKYTIPSKVFDYLQVGKPIISTIQGEGREILELSEANILTDLDEDSLSISFKTMYEKYDYFNSHCNRNIELSNRFSREKSNQILLRYIKSITHTESKH